MSSSAPSPLRIASLISSGTEMLYALGLGENVVAVSHECDFPPQVADRPRVTRSNVDSSSSSDDIDRQVQRLAAGGQALYEIDRATLVELRPDVIVTQAQCDVCAVRYEDVLDVVHSSPDLARTRVIALNPQSLEDVFADVLRLGEELGAANRARRFVDELRSRVEAIQVRTEKIPADRRPRVACIEWIEPLMLAANWTPELIEIAGGNCPLATAGAHSTYGSWETVVEFDPQVLIIAPCGFDLPRTIHDAGAMRTWPSYAQLSAVKSGRVYAVDGNAYLNRSGPRLVDSVEILAHLFHPETFPPPGCFKTSCAGVKY